MAAVADAVSGTGYGIDHSTNIGVEDNSWRTGPIDLTEAPSAKSAKRIELSRYSAFGRQSEHVVKNPGNRRLLADLQHGSRPRRIPQSRLRELSTTKLGQQLQERMAQLDSESSIGLGGGSIHRGGMGSSDSIGMGARRRRPQSAAAAASTLRYKAGRRRRVRLKDVPPEALSALRLLLSSSGIPTQYASALACFGFNSVGELTRATHQNLLDVGLRANHARALRRMLDSSFDAAGLPLAPQELPVAELPKRPASAPPRAGAALSVATENAVPQYADNYSNPTPQLDTGTPGASPHPAGASNGLDSLLATLEMTTGEEAAVPLPPEQVVTAEIADAAADVAADLLATHSGQAGFAASSGRPQSAKAARPQSATLSRSKASRVEPVVAENSEPLDGSGFDPRPSLDQMEESLQSEVLKLDELERIEAELQAEIARLRASGAQAGIITGGGSGKGTGGKARKKKGRAQRPASAGPSGRRGGRR